MATILLTHPPQVRENYYSDRALAGLSALGEVRRNPLGRELNTAELIDAAQCGKQRWVGNCRGRRWA